MNDIKKLLELKIMKKRKNPNFLRQDGHKKKRLEQKWRAPKGLHSKMRLGLRGYRVKIDDGYRTPVVLRGMNRQGMLPVRVCNLDDLQKINPKSETAIIANTVGNKKRIAMIEEAKKKGISIMNIKVDKFMEKIKQEKDAKKAQQKQVKEEKIENKEVPKEELSQEEKKKQENKEKEKVMTKRM